MSEIVTVGLDLAKSVFQVHGADGSGQAVLRKKLRRDQVLEFFGRLLPEKLHRSRPNRPSNLGHETLTMPVSSRSTGTRM